MQSEQRLFLNVIIQLIEDFISPLPVGANLTERRLAKIQAETWFKGNTTDYKEVCENAGIDATKLRKHILSSTTSDIQGLLNDFRKLYLSSTVRGKQEV